MFTALVLSCVLSAGFEIECPDATHPETAVLRCPVNPACPDVDGVSTATVFDYTPKLSDGKPAKPLHKIRSVSPCGCVGTWDLCDCVPNGTYKGTCKSRLCTYEIKCAEIPKIPQAPEAVKHPVRSVEPPKLAPTAAAPASPLSQAITKLMLDAQALEAAKAKVAALAQAQAELDAVNKTIAADQKTIADLLNGLPTPTPVVHTVEIVMISSTTCGPCRVMLPILAGLRGEGMAIRKLDTDNPAEAQEAASFNAPATPCFISLVDGKEVARSVGVLSASALRTWYKDTLDWTKKLK